jgi:putative hemolysin
MAETASQKGFDWSAALRLGNHSFVATLLLVALAVFGGLSLLPFLGFVFGAGWVAPLVAVLVFFTILFLFKSLVFKNLYRNSPGDEDAALLEYLVQQNASGVPGEEELEMELLENALQLKQIRAHDCMVPRTEIVHIDVEAPVEELRRLYVESSLSRILVTDGDIDKIMGYVHVQQMFTQPRNIRSIVMPMTYVPESIQVNDLLSKFIKNRTYIACVVDEYGGVAGLVTLENVLEQLFGKIDDEHDLEEFIEAKIGEREYLFSGRLDVEYINEKYPELDIPHGSYNTISGYIVSHAQTIPQQGAKLRIGGKTFVLELVSDRKIETIRVLW